jgi:hypothetical protein
MNGELKDLIKYKLMKKKKEKKILYHATAMTNLGSILDKGLLKGYDGGVYLTESVDSAFKWMGFRIAGRDDLVVIKVEPGCDHSPIMQQIFGCGESYFYPFDIPSSKLKDFIKFETKNHEVNS